MTKLEILNEIDRAELAYARSLPVILCKGASNSQVAEENAQAGLQQQETQFYQQLQSSYAQQFAGQNQILQQLNAAFSPILAAGPNQQGFSPTQLATLNTQATDATGAQYANALKATQEQLAAQGGGNSAVTSGAAAQLKSQVGNAAANQESSELLNIQNANYNTGRQNFLAASSALSGTLGAYNPTGYAGAATGAGSAASSSANAAFNEATTIQQMNNAASPLNIIGGVLGGAASAFLGGGGGLLGTLGENIANQFNTSGPAPYTPSGPDSGASSQSGAPGDG